MASIKNLKKEINNLCYEVVSDCFTYILVNEDKNRDAVLKIISETISFRNDLIGKLQNPDEEITSKGLKKYYKTLRTELLSGMDKSLKKLSTLSKK